MNLVFALAAAVLFGAGAYLLLKRDLVRVVVGVSLISQSAILTLLASALTRGPAPIHPLPDAPVSDPVVQSLALGLTLLALFLVGAVLVARVPVLREPVQELLDHAEYGSLAVVAVITAVNGVAEELY